MDSARAPARLGITTKDPHADSLDDDDFRAHIHGVFLAMTREEQIDFLAALNAAHDALVAGEEFHASVPTNYDVEKAEHFARMIRTTGLTYTLRKFRGAPVGRLRSARPRERRSSRGRRRASTTARDDGSDSDEPGPSSGLIHLGPGTRGYPTAADVEAVTS